MALFMLPLLRFTLDLFEEKLPLSPVYKAFAAPFSGAINAPNEVAQVTFKHPLANHQIRFVDALVAYEFKRSKRRTIGFGVGPNGLEVRAPTWVTLREVDAVLRGKEKWILRKLQEAQQRQQRLASQVIDWRDGVTLPYLGQTLTVVLDPALDGVAGGAEFVTADPAAPVLRISLAHQANAAQIRDRVQAWLIRQAKLVFQQRLNHFAPQLGVQWTKLSLSNAATRWGSARSDGSIRLNWRLLHFTMPVLDYVVVHELSHLRVMDHSPRFWQTVASVVPDHASLRRELKHGEAPSWAA